MQPPLPFQSPADPPPHAGRPTRCGPGRGMVPPDPPLLPGLEPVQTPPLDEAEAAAFWAKVRRAGGGECWLWTASLNHKGYGYFRLRRKTSE